MHLLPQRPLNAVNSNDGIKEKMETFGKTLRGSKGKQIRKNSCCFFSPLDNLLASRVRLRKDPPGSQGPRMFAFPFLWVPVPSWALYIQTALTFHCRVFKNIKLPLCVRLRLSSAHICKVRW